MRAEGRNGQEGSGAGRRVARAGVRHQRPRSVVRDGEAVDAGANRPVEAGILVHASPSSPIRTIGAR
jgi:hypothetical protein